MISREFIYEFSNFDDISTRENDKKSRAHDICRSEMGVWYKFEGIGCQKAGCAEPAEPHKTALRAADPRFTAQVGQGLAKMLIYCKCVCRSLRVFTILRCRIRLFI